MIKKLFGIIGTRPADAALAEPTPLSTSMKKTINYYGSVIDIDVEPEISTTRYQIRTPMNGGSEELRIAEEVAKNGALGYGMLIRTETDILSRVSVTINNRPFAEGEPKREELKTWIETQVAAAMLKIDRSTKLSTVGILTEMGFETEQL